MSGAVRVWRLRKNSTWLEARLSESAEERGVELRFFRDNTLISSRRWPTREEAMADAERQLRELQRAGWNSHW
jgi:hypothetical protein